MRFIQCSQSLVQQRHQVSVVEGGSRNKAKINIAFKWKKNKQTNRIWALTNGMANLRWSEVVLPLRFKSLDMNVYCLFDISTFHCDLHWFIRSQNASFRLNVSENSDVLSIRSNVFENDWNGTNRSQKKIRHVFEKCRQCETPIEADVI